MLSFDLFTSMQKTETSFFNLEKVCKKNKTKTVQKTENGLHLPVNIKRKLVKADALFVCVNNDNLQQYMYLQKIIKVLNIKNTFTIDDAEGKDVDLFGHFPVVLDPYNTNKKFKFILPSRCGGAWEGSLLVGIENYSQKGTFVLTDTASYDVAKILEMGEHGMVGSLSHTSKSMLKGKIKSKWQQVECPKEILALSTSPFKLFERIDDP